MCQFFTDLKSHHDMFSTVSARSSVSWPWAHPVSSVSPDATMTGRLRSMTIGKVKPLVQSTTNRQNFELRNRDHFPSTTASSSYANPYEPLAGSENRHHHVIMIISYSHFV